MNSFIDMSCIWPALPPFCNIVGVLLGFGLSLGVGHLCVGLFHKWMQAKLPPLIDEPSPKKEIQVAWTGFVERALFTFFVIVQPGPALPAMMVWLGQKMASNWNKALPAPAKGNAREDMIIRNRHAFLGLLTGLISMGFAWTGGMLASFVMDLEF